MCHQQQQHLLLLLLQQIRIVSWASVYLWKTNDHYHSRRSCLSPPTTVAAMIISRVIWIVTLTWGDLTLQIPILLLQLYPPLYDGGGTAGGTHHPFVTQLVDTIVLTTVSRLVHEVVFYCWKYSMTRKRTTKSDTTTTDDDGTRWSNNNPCQQKYLRIQSVAVKQQRIMYQQAKKRTMLEVEKDQGGFVITKAIYQSVPNPILDRRNNSGDRPKRNITHPRDEDGSDTSNVVVSSSTDADAPFAVDVGTRNSPPARTDDDSDDDDTSVAGFLSFDVTIPCQFWVKNHDVSTTRQPQRLVLHRPFHK
jgi:hypothetical protein